MENEIYFYFEFAKLLKLLCESDNKLNILLKFDCYLEKWLNSCVSRILYYIYIFFLVIFRLENHE